MLRNIRYGVGAEVSSASVHADDVALVGRMLGGDKASFDAFYASYFPKVYRFCLSRLRDEEACRDVVQQSLIAAMKGLHTYRGEASLYTWLCQIGRHEIALWLKKQGKHAANAISLDASADMQDFLAAIPSPDSVEDEAGAIHSLVHLALDHLPEHYRQILELKYIEGLSVTEIAVALKTGELAVQSLLARARGMFKKVFLQLREG